MAGRIQRERVETRTSLAVRGSRGTEFGTLCWVEGDRLMVETDAPFTARETCEIKIDISPHPGTVLMKARVTRQLVTSEDEMSRFVLRIVEVGEDDDQAFRAWLEFRRAGGTVRDFSLLSSPRTGGAQATPSERRVAIQRLDARSGAAWLSADAEVVVID